MVPKLSDGKDAVRDYVAEHASQGLDEVLALVAAAFGAVLALIDDLTEDEASYRVAPEEWSIWQTLQHLNASFPRSIQRLNDLTHGREYAAPPGRSGSLPDVPPASFDVSRREFREGTAGVMRALNAAKPDEHLDVTSDHALLGPFNWMEWAVYSHHVHTDDHIGQIHATKREIVARRARA